MKFLLKEIFLIRKIISLLFVITLLSKNLFCLFGRNSIKLKNSISQNKNLSTQKFKFLFMMKLNTIKEDSDHPLNQMSYKNILLSTSQVVYFVSSNSNNSVK
jgi:hypothetical protein